MFFVSACRNSSSTRHKQKETLDTTASKFAGVFTDTIPCADCAGIVMTIDVKPDHTYVLEEDYLAGKKEHFFYSVGQWLITDSILNLTNSSEGARQYEILNNAEIRLLDNAGKPITSAIDKYSLRRSLTPFKPASSIPVNGMYTAKGDTMHLFICKMAKTFSAAIAPDVLTMKTEYQEQQKAHRDTVMVYVEGHFELRPSLKTTDTEDFFVVDKFIRFAPLESCK